ncbi:DUF4919 domain-containing protein [Methylovirgula sp. 4M-Z18]|uniref:DUF4919 domain-containing protein n=1 Tax=Methylovirgula sp. 4M-Z18 TaxID=2293567 RepID=UPI001314660B|nr:DUF4919 domain-containing protein [Methylovirgula sp. 4M-Z18]
MRNVLGLGFLVVVAAFALAHRASADDRSDKTYLELAASARRIPASADWTALRQAYVNSSYFDLIGVKTDTIRKALWAARQNNDYEGVIRAADTILAENYVDLEAHIMRYAALRALGRTSELAQDKMAIDGLMASIQNGEGGSPQSAWNAITVHEEYVTLSLMGFKVQSQSLINATGHAYDRFDVIDRDQRHIAVYFLVDQILAAEKKALNPPN